MSRPKGYRNPSGKHDPHCVVCGEPLMRKMYQSQTCGAPECRAAIVLHPELKDEGRTDTPRGRGCWKPMKRISVIRMLRELHVDTGRDAAEALYLGALELSRTAYWASDDWGMMEDERGADIPQSSEIWSWMSNRTALLKTVAHEEGEASLVVRRRPRESVADAVLRSLGLAYPDMCDVFYAWRCPCPTDTRRYYDSINDLPDRAGYHDPCPRCGAAPLEVIDVAE